MKRFIFCSNIKEEIQKILKEFSTFIKDNKYKVGFSLGLNIFSPNLSRFYTWGRTLYATGGIINTQTNSEINKAVKTTFSGILNNRNLYTLGQDLRNITKPNRVISSCGLHQHKIQKDNPRFFKAFWKTTNTWINKKKDINKKLFSERNRQSYCSIFKKDNKWVHNISNDVDDPGNISTETKTIVLIKEKLGLDISQITRPTIQGCGDIIIEKDGKLINYDIKTDKRFFQNDPDESLKNIFLIQEKLSAKNRELIIDGSEFPIEKVEQLRFILEKNNINIIVVHPSEFKLENEISKLIQEDEITNELDIKAEWLVDKAN